METITVSGNTMSQEPMSMGRRALLTESEREAIQNPESKDNPYVAISRVRTKIEDELPEDIEILREHRPDLLEDLQEVVCADVDQEGHSSPVNEPKPTLDESPERTQETQETAKETQEIDALDGLEFPSGKDQSECKATIRAARDYLENAPASKKDIVSEIMPQYPLGYDSKAALSKIESGDRYRGAWWRRIVKPGLEALDDVQKPARGQSEWRVTNEQRS